MQPSFAFLRKLFMKREKEINTLKLTLQYAMKTVSCKEKGFACKECDIAWMGIQLLCLPYHTF